MATDWPAPAVIGVGAFQVSMLATFACLKLGANSRRSPTRRLPLSMRPTTRRRSSNLNTSWIGRRSGWSVATGAEAKLSSAASMVGPWYQGILSDLVAMLSPWRADTGTMLVGDSFSWRR